MAGDFYDVFRSAPTPRLAAVIGDVAGHGIEPSITAFQAKYLLRVFLRQYRDPAQALEELNAQMSAMGRRRGVHLAVRRGVRHRGRHPAVRVGRSPRRLAVARARGAPAAGHRAAADARSGGDVHQPGDPARVQRPLPALHRRAGRGAQRRVSSSARSASPGPPARPGRRRRTCCASRCSKRPATSPAAPSPTTSPSSPSAGPEQGASGRDLDAGPATHVEQLAMAAKRALAGNLEQGGREARPQQNKLFVRDRLDLLLDPGIVRRGRAAGQRDGRRPAGRRRGHRRRARSTAGRCA